MSVEENLRLQIEKLRGQIYANPGDEANTRSVLIDPLLRELGWATDDLAQVRREYSVGRSKVDYALFKDGEQKPAVLIEAKKLSTYRNLLRDAAIQGVGYCLTAEIRYVAVTDGGRWDIYDTYQSGETRNASVHVLDRMWLKSVDLFDPEGGLSINNCRLAEEL